MTQRDKIYLRSPCLPPSLFLPGFTLELLQLLSDLQPVGGLGLLPRDAGDGDLRDRVISLHHGAAAPTFPLSDNLVSPDRGGRTPGTAQCDVLRGTEVEERRRSDLVPAGLLSDDGHRHAHPNLLGRVLGHRHLGSVAPVVLSGQYLLLLIIQFLVSTRSLNIDRLNLIITRE